MTTKRLEELADKCAVAIDGVGRNASYGLSDSDLRDLAQCARAWAKLEEIGCKWWYINHYEQALFFGQGLHYSCDRHHTAIAAVEAAPEVKP